LNAGKPLSASEPSDIYSDVDLSFCGVDFLVKLYDRREVCREFHLNILNLNSMVDWIRRRSLVHGEPAILRG